MTTENEQPSPANDQATDVDQLRQAIKQAGLSQRAAARELGVDDRTMRYWCAGQSTPPPMALRALDPWVRHHEVLKQTMRSNQELIERLESGMMTVNRGPQLGTAETAAAEAQRLRRKNEELHALVRLEEAFQRRQSAWLAVHGQMTPVGDGVPTDESMAQLDAAKAEFCAAQQEFDRITDEIRAGRR